MKYLRFLCVVLVISTFTLSPVASEQLWQDRPFLQDDVIKYQADPGAKLYQVRSDRNGIVLVLSDKGLLTPFEKKLVRETRHRPLTDMKIHTITTYQSQFVYLTDQAVLSNAWAGKYFLETNMPEARLFAVGNNFDILVAEPKKIQYNSQPLTGFDSSTLVAITFDPKRNVYYLLSKDKLSVYQPGKNPKPVVTGTQFTCLALIKNDSELLLGSHDGFWRINAETFTKESIERQLPWTDITCIQEIGDNTWFGTSRGAFCIDAQGQIGYYAADRWLLDDQVVDLAAGPGQSVLVLSGTGLNHIRFKPMTLAQKADHFDRLIRQRHIRYGLNSKFVMEKSGNLSTGTLLDQDNDGLWTAMYLAGELFRYQVTKTDAARQNCYESFEAMERLYTINHIKGFPARAFERRGYQTADQQAWQPAQNPHWDWKATTSSDEIVGHFFVLSLFAEFIEDPAWRQRAVTLMDECMDHIVRNNWYLVDYDGKPTRWGRWHPEYVNGFPKEVGDRRLNSVEIIAFLQTAYHFTGKELYKQKAYELFDQHGYLDNIMIPITHIGFVEGVDLSTDWNHSDDELAFLSYWNLYRYAFTDSLKAKYQETIYGHWHIERPEKNPLWNFITAAMPVQQFDLDQAIWTLQKLPLDFIGWNVHNSHRKDLEFLPANFRNQTITQVLPPGERPIAKYNSNAFDLDGGENGRREYSGDIYTLPYWLGRYLKLISE